MGELPKIEDADAEKEDDEDKAVQFDDNDDDENDEEDDGPKDEELPEIDDADQDEEDDVIESDDDDDNDNQPKYKGYCEPIIRGTKWDTMCPVFKSVKGCIAPRPKQAQCQWTRITEEDV